MKIHYITLGCKVNRFETDSVRLLFEKEGHTTSSSLSDSDVIIVNTCAVTGEAERKSKAIVRRMKKQNPMAIVAICGCVPQMLKDVSDKSLGADIICGTTDRLKLPGLLSKYMEKNTTQIHLNKLLPSLPFEPLQAENFDGRTRATLKIEDGCENFCTYCIIPHVRGPVRFMDYDKALYEIESLSRLGYKEIVLSGIQISDFGKNKDYSLLKLLKATEKIPGDFRIRLGSLNLKLFTDEFFEALPNLKKLCPHFHISLQSGCDKTLKAMGRRYESAEYRKVYERLRASLGDSSITTDIIVGFPGETDEGFEESLSFAQSLDFLKIHVFPYSMRIGTPAAAMDNQVANDVKSIRVKKMTKISADCRKNFLHPFLHKTFDVLFEMRENRWCEGFSRNYIPIKVETSLDLQGTVKKVRLEEISEGTCIGSLV